jgi:hypothetical protein
MGKIGDLIVRLQLKHEDYQKGLKQAKKDTDGFGATLGKIKGAGVAVWAAIGASVISFGKQLIKSSQTIGDAWNRMTSQVKAGWDVFVQSVGAWNWDNFIGRIKEATVAAKALTNALDAEFEVSNSVKLQKAAMAEELAALEVLARDQTKSYDQRAEAAQKYLDMVKPLYDQELMLAKRLEDAHIGKFLAGSGLQDTAQVRADLKKFLVDIGKIPTLLDDLSAQSSAQKTIDKGANAFGSNYKKLNAAYDVRNQMRAKLKDVQSGYQTDLVALFRAYNDMRGDEDAKPMVDAMIRAGEAAGAFDRETKRMQSALNTSLSQISKHDETSNGSETIANIERDIIEPLERLSSISAPAVQMTLPDIIPDDWIERNREKVDEALAEAMRLQSITDDINRSFEDAVVTSLSGATQAFTDCVAGIEGADASDVMVALMQPFANTMMQLGEMLIAEGLAITAFKESLKSLDPTVALTAGVALLALGAALSSGIKALGNGASSGATTSAASSSSAGSSVGSGIETYAQEITVRVTGTLSGSDILLAGEKTQNKWNR